MEEIPRRARERLAHEEAIVAAAEKAFIRKGFEAASMDEIAKEAEFTKRTLYQYFPSKEDLFFAVVLKGFRTMNTYLSNANEPASNGFQRIRQSFRAYYAFYRKHPDTFKLISRWGYMKNQSLETNPSQGNLQEFNHQMFGGIADTLRKGIADGSIRHDLPVEGTVYSLVFLITGFLAQLSITGESFTRQFNLDLEKFCFSTIDMVLVTLGPPSTSRFARKGKTL